MAQYDFPLGPKSAQALDAAIDDGNLHSGAMREAGRETFVESINENKPLFFITDEDPIAYSQLQKKLLDKYYEGYLSHYSDAPIGKSFLTDVYTKVVEGVIPQCQTGEEPTYNQSHVPSCDLPICAPGAFPQKFVDQDKFQPTDCRLPTQLEFYEAQQQNERLTTANQKLQTFHDKYDGMASAAEFGNIFVNRSIIGGTTIAAVASKLALASQKAVTNGAKPFLTHTRTDFDKSFLTKEASRSLAGALIVGMIINAGLAFWDYQNAIESVKNRYDDESNKLRDQAAETAWIDFGTDTIALVMIAGFFSLALTADIPLATVLLTGLAASACTLKIKEYIKNKLT